MNQVECVWQNFMLAMWVAMLLKTSKGRKYILKKKTRKCPRISKLNLKDKQIDYLEFFFG